VAGTPNDLAAGGGGGGGGGSNSLSAGAGGAGGGGGNIDSTIGFYSLGAGYLGSAGSTGLGGLGGGGGGGGGSGGLVLTGPVVNVATNGFDVTGGAGGGSVAGGGIAGIGGGGGAGLVLLDGGLVTVSGSVIAGGAGGNAGATGGGGGAGLFLYGGGALANQVGAIRGGNGGGVALSANSGGDGGVGVLSNLGTIGNQATIAGGTGGYGVTGGGRGGIGLAAWGGSVVNEASGSISGGEGGSLSQPGRFFPAGSGGAGVQFLDGQAASLSNAGTIEGGAGGATPAGDNPVGVGGVAIVGALSGNISIVNSGTTNGGVDSRGAVRSNAISLFGSGNRLELRAGSTINGDVVVSGGAGNTLVLGGATDANFDASQIGATQQYRGFDTYEKTGASTWTLTGTGNQIWSVVTGALKADTNSLAGSVRFASGAGSRSVTFDQAFDGTYSGTIFGTGTVTKTGTGTVTLAGLSSVDWTISAGGLITAAERFGGNTAVAAGASLTFDQVADATYAGGLSGSGRVRKTGSGRLSLTGDSSSFTGGTTVENGTLSVNSTLARSAVTVQSGATLGGNGTVGATTIQPGATIAPGNSIGTLNVNGNLLLAPGSTYEVEIAGNGASDRIAATGIATVTGSLVGVTALDPQTSYITGQRYTIITATGGVNGTVAGAVSRSAFLDLMVEHRPNRVDLVIALKDTPPVTPPGSGPTTPPAIFGTVAQTRNQFATAAGLDTLPQAGGTLALYNSLLMLDAPSARQAFDALSGEIHASAKSALVDESWLLRAAINDRLRSAFGAVGASPMATLNYGFSADLAPSATGPMPRLRTDRFAVWGQGYGSWGRTDSDHNAAKLTRSTGGFLIGADVAVFDTMRLGVVAGYSRSEFDANARLSSGESDNYHLGLYGGGQWGALGLHAGASYTWHDIETRRTVAFAGFGDSLKSDYDAGTAQVFGELGYRVDLGQTVLGKVALEPFAGLAYVNLHTDGLSETGRAAALTARSDGTSLGYSTLGLRGSTTFALQGMDLTLRGGLAWRHAFGDVDPKATLAFAGSNPFSVAGLPIARDAATVEAGLDLAISKSAALGLAYTGQLAKDAQDHAFKANLAVRF
jgi:outer membrane autotransporter protein